MASLVPFVPGDLIKHRAQRDGSNWLSEVGEVGIVISLNALRTPIVTCHILWGDFIESVSSRLIIHV